MLKHIVAISFVFLCAAIAWVVLGAAVQFRTHGQDAKLRQSVHQIWVVPQVQQAPSVYWTAEDDRHSLPLYSSRIDVDLALDHRRKGLLWYATYRVDFTGDYVVENSTDQARALVFDFALPAPEAVYDGLGLRVGDRAVRPVLIEDGRLRHRVHLQPGERQGLRIHYASQGLDEWWYSFGADVSQVRDFALAMRTDFDAVDFPLESMAPTDKEPLPGGWALEWRYGELFTGVDIGLALPQKLYPMHYFFVAAAFFFEGYAGLALTALSIATLFAAMQLTGRLDWERAFAGRPPADAAP